MPACEHLIYKKSGEVAPCGKSAKYEYLGRAVCSRHCPDYQDEVRERKAQKRNQSIANMLQKMSDFIAKYP